MGHSNWDTPMQFKIHVEKDAPDLHALTHAFAEMDPSAVVDSALQGNALRLSTVLRDVDILNTCKDAGWMIDARQIEQLPSECCGGCGG
jgi:hypothetical protein